MGSIRMLLPLPGAKTSQDLRLSTRMLPLASTPFSPRLKPLPSLKPYPWPCPEPYPDPTPHRSRRPRRMETVSSTLGGSTRTCWNRRSRALSFSMYLRRYDAIT